MGLPDKSFAISIIVILKIADGKVIHQADYMDSATFNRQVAEQAK